SRGPAPSSRGGQAHSDGHNLRAPSPRRVARCSIRRGFSRTARRKAHEMRCPWLLRRELALVFGARVTWGVVAISALLVGHGFVLALDLYTAASRSAVNHILMEREMDPLLGMVRPTLGSLYVGAALLLPVTAARGLAVEKERQSYGALAIRAGGTE